MRLALLRLLPAVTLAIPVFLLGGTGQAEARRSDARTSAHSQTSTGRHVARRAGHQTPRVAQTHRRTTVTAPAS